MAPQIIARIQLDGSTCRFTEAEGRPVMLHHEDECVNGKPQVHSKEHLKDFCACKAKNFAWGGEEYYHVKTSRRWYKLNQKFWTYLHNRNREMFEKTLVKLEEEAYNQLEVRREGYEQFGHDHHNYFFEDVLFPIAVPYDVSSPESKKKTEFKINTLFHMYMHMSGKKWDEIQNMLDNDTIIKKIENGNIQFYRRWYGEGAYIQNCKCIKEELEQVKDMVKKYYLFYPLEAIARQAK